MVRLTLEASSNYILTQNDSGYVDKHNWSGVTIKTKDHFGEITGWNTICTPISRKILHYRWSNCFFRTGTEGYRTPTIGDIILQNAQNLHRFFAENGLILAVFCKCALSTKFGVDEGRSQMSAGQFQFLNYWKSGWRQLGEKMLSWRSLSSYHTWWRPLTSRVARRWTHSRWAMRFTVERFGEQTADHK